MADLRAKLRARVEPFLEPGEVVQGVFPAQLGNPWITGLAVGLPLGIGLAIGSNAGSLLAAVAVGAVLGGIGGLAAAPLRKPRAVAATDRAILVVALDPLTGAGRSVQLRLPRSTPLGPMNGIWAKLPLGGERLWVHRRYQDDARACDRGEPRPDVPG